MLFVMIVLGLDTSTRTSGIALVEDDRLIADARVDLGARVLADGLSGRARDGASPRGADLLVAIDEVCRRAGLPPARLDAIAIGAGPGSFTGLRIGMSTEGHSRSPRA